MGRNIKLTSIIEKKTLLQIFIFFVIISALLTYTFIHFEAFEELHEFSRLHEDWQLDEFILAFISIVLSLSVTSIILTIILGKKVLKNIKDSIENEKKLQRAQKLQSMGSLLGGLSHSLNNHLLPILTISKIIKSETDKNNQTYEDISKVIEAAESSRDILKQVLNFTRNERKATKNYSIIDKTLERTLMLIKTSLPSSISLQKDISVNNIIVPISKVNMEIIILNLIMNSQYAMNNKTGNIFVTLKESNKNKDLIELIIKDEGEGIKKDDLNRIFDPFFTTKKTGEGTGLGLSETYGIITNIGGDIVVNSEINKFTEFIIYIPKTKGEIIE